MKIRKLNKILLKGFNLRLIGLPPRKSNLGSQSKEYISEQKE